MLARDLMSTGLLTFLPDMGLEPAARAMAERGVSGAPVVREDGLLVGVITEGDLIRRLADAAAPKSGWFASLFRASEEDAARFARVRGRTVKDVMTMDVASVTEDATAEQIAHVMESRGIRRVPVLRDGVLVGVVSRADLLRALIFGEDGTAVARSDAEIRRALSAALRQQPWFDRQLMFVDVADGVVRLHGFCGSEDIRRALRVLAEGLPGVKRVETDFTAPPPFLLGAR
ncbi:CBS domain-containing protein [Roseomonas eburnea]|jgi:CBS domain-containing protein|uniref:CBS domain-containing protein n=1 Tax=Neoroseomonas eburnea TaxID=1346889 RepID=A0A9X9XI51_9PROT|nr:CBS domain-containing protein [Neoroseomonas eburnea]MBR0683387.1 CBS domain-containing protein [Neoroseomonas eburnea]